MTKKDIKDRTVEVMTVKEWNDARWIQLRERDLEILGDLENIGEYPQATKFLCTWCQHPVTAQAHINDTGRKWKRQVVCSNSRCGKVDYLVL